MKAHTAETQATINPAKALQFLKEGNQRFVNNLKINRNLLEQANNTKNGQFPFAIVLSCIDSRTSAELIFDQGLGDIFSVRIAGNVINDDILGSMEFACKLAGTKLIVILGHSNCGAVKGACAGQKLGHLTGILDKVNNSVEEVRLEMPEVAYNDPKLIEAVTKHHIIDTMDQILSKSPILNELFEQGDVGIACGYHNIETGQVTFMKEVLHD